MQITSNDIQPNQRVPVAFTCDGEDKSPHLAWAAAPEGTKSFALSCLDPDSPSGEWAHWLVVNIPSMTSELPFGTVIQPPALEITNDFGYSHYGGPCPHSGEHRYFFTIYALDVDTLEGVTRQSFKEKVAKHLLDKAEIMATYQR